MLMGDDIDRHFCFLPQTLDLTTAENFLLQEYLGVPAFASLCAMRELCLPHETISNSVDYAADL